ncbi:MAG: DUF4082 domain-containing protein, partial [Nocardioidaceae bacterium]|nr:DUF4082 domain-containing protein [Nocardioidaceae bacterium]
GAACGSRVVGLGKSLGTLAIPSTGEVGWQKASFASPVKLEAGSTYAASFSVRAGVPYAVLRDGTAGGGSSYSVLGGARALKGHYPAKVMKGVQFLVRPVLGRVITETPSSFPDAANTGVPGGVSLSAYTGTSMIRADGAVIDSRQVNGRLSIQAENVVITHSLVNGNIEIREGGSLTISDSTVDGGTFDGSAVGQYNVTMRRVEVVGARQSLSCNQNCDIQDSWLHGQYIQPGSDWHGDGFVSNGGSDMLVRHNTLACDSETSGNGGCSGAVALFADFDPITDVTIDANLFTAGRAAYCLYGGYDPGKPYGDNPTNVVITSNVFQRGANRKCAAFGAAAAVADSGEGNVFEGNVWDDGKKVRQP